MKILRKLREKINPSEIDVYIISYPKCGRTWFRMIIGKYLNDVFNLNLRPSQLSEIQSFFLHDSKIPRFELKHEGSPQHIHIENIEMDFEKFSGVKTVFFCRDPRPTSVSFFHQYKYRGAWNKSVNKKHQVSIDDFVRRDVGGIRSIIKYYNLWEPYLNSGEEVLKLGYEGLKEDSLKECSRFLQFCNISVDEVALSRAIEFCKAENLKKLEVNGELNEMRFGGDEKGSKVRNVGKRKWYDEVRSDTKLYMDSHVEQLSKFYGYS